MCTLTFGMTVQYLVSVQPENIPLINSTLHTDNVAILRRNVIDGLISSTPYSVYYMYVMEDDIKSGISLHVNQMG